MSTLAPGPVPRRFPDLMALGRARLPSLAPEWTDHNAHDPGITLLELLAWVAEAQIYAATRMRRDERAAYASLLGVAPRGTRPARGVIWRDPLDHQSPAVTFDRSVVLERDAVVNVVGADTPTFRPVERLLWVPGSIVRLETRRDGATTADHTTTNDKGGPPFLPFGMTAGPRNVLRMTFRPRGDAGLFPPGREGARGARWAIGVRAADSSPVTAAAGATPAVSTARSPVQATLIIGQQRVRVPIVSDSTNGLLATGVLLLDLDGVTGEPTGDVLLELRAPAGLPRPPRLLRIEPSVVPVEQGRAVDRELHTATGQPDWGFVLDVAGLRFGSGEPPVKVEVTGEGGFGNWSASEGLAESSPGEQVYELDYASARVTFGNGFNGRVPPAEAQVLVSYRVSDGAAGAVARNRKWRVAGLGGGAFGINPDPVAEGVDASGSGDDRREGRRRVRHEHALVTPDDIVSAALELPDLEVARAWVPPPDPQAPRTGAITLVAMRSRGAGPEPADVPETQRWLNAVRSALAPHIPLGTRLLVAAPQYRDFSIEASVVAEEGRDPATVKTDVVKALESRLAVVARPGGAPPRRPGVPVTRRDVVAWIRAVEGVKSVGPLRLAREATDAGEVIAVPASGLPRLVAANITVVRAGTENAA